MLIVLPLDFNNEKFTNSDTNDITLIVLEILHMVMLSLDNDNGAEKI